jgi:hypothetical protein
MRKLIKVVVLLLVAASVYAATYDVNVTRVEQDLYKVTGFDMYIKTMYCYEYAYNQDAVISYDKNSYTNSILFTESGESCKVKAVYR